eukprot:1880086-Karenia_brevis.AAC.1
MWHNCENTINRSVVLTHKLIVLCTLSRTQQFAQLPSSEWQWPQWVLQGVICSNGAVVYVTHGREACAKGFYI